MTISNLKDLKQLIELCQKTGVEAIEVDGVKLNLRPMAPATRKRRKLAGETKTTSDGTQDLSDVIDTDELTPEQMLFYSVTSNPDGATGEQ